MRIVSRLLLVIEVDEEDRGRAEEQRVIVPGTDEGIECDEPIAAWTIFNHDRLAPARTQPVGEQPCGDVHSTGGAEGQNEANGARRIGLLRLGVASRDDRRQNQDRRCKKPQHRLTQSAHSFRTTGFHFPDHALTSARSQRGQCAWQDGLRAE